MSEPEYAVNTLYATIQGEGYWTGTPAIFIRLQGCAVGCPWCDTRHTWERSARDWVETLAQAQAREAAWCSLTAEALFNHCQRHYSHIRHVVITGGEPCEQDLEPLLRAWGERDGEPIQIETSGTAPLPTLGWVTLSPKLNMPGGLSVPERAYQRANEIKHVVVREEDIDRLETAIQGIRPHDSVTTLRYLQPVSQSARATQICIDRAMAGGYRLSVQTHKYISLP